MGECDFKTLSLNGQRKELIKVPTPSQEEFKAQNYKSDEWPITHEMLYEALNSNWFASFWSTSLKKKYVIKNALFVLKIFFFCKIEIDFFLKHFY